MTRTARILAAVYALAILVAGLGPHCGLMFARADTAVAAAADRHDCHRGHAAKDRSPDRICAAMEMAKLAGPLPAVLGFSAPGVVAILPPMPALQPAAAITPAAVPSARGPPPAGEGFAAVFARNHRLLI
ncbi:MAG: hypothetical protein IT548_13105 [Alphaproteobacteria bacterium]|nr:hypothetical protein [Alphaproteobacteria bacterium]